MILARNLFFVVCIFVFILLMLSFIPSNQWIWKDHTYPVYFPTDNFSDQLVHFLVSESFSLKIKKVDTDNEALSVDFVVKDSVPDIKSVYTDLANLITDGFNQFSNINDIRTRIIVHNGDQERLLIGVLARRNQLKTQHVKEQWNVDKLASYLHNQFNVTYGPAWTEYNQSPPK